MIKTIKNKYYSYNPNEFMPIYIEGKLSNRAQFHAYKSQKALDAIGSVLAPVGNRIDNFFVNH